MARDCGCMSDLALDLPIASSLGGAHPGATASGVRIVMLEIGSEPCRCRDGVSVMGGA
jgi:hypothetical protein